MREIKFRAWNKIIKIMSESFNLKCLKNGYFMDKENTIKPVAFYLSDCELMQYTGLKDKNGKEIYEGDIVRQSMSGNLIWVNIVTWNSSESKFHIAPGNCDFSKNDTEIIGNIHENPELQYEGILEDT